MRCPQHFGWWRWGRAACRQARTAMARVPEAGRRHVLDASLCKVTSLMGPQLSLCPGSFVDVHRRKVAVAAGAAPRSPRRIRRAASSSFLCLSRPCAPRLGGRPP